jgi:Tfp pilus assembly protein FimT
MARSEAVNRNVDVWVTFLPGAAAADADGYRVWVDDWDAGGGAPGSDGLYTDGSDTLVRETVFPVAVQFYDKNGTDGPDKEPDMVTPLDVEDGIGDDDNGIVFDSGSANDDEVAFTSRGTAINSDGDPLVNTGYVYIYFPASATDHVTMRSAPYALVVTSGTGRVRISRWDKTNAAWSRK